MQLQMVSANANNNDVVVVIVEFSRPSRAELAPPRHDDDDDHFGLSIPNKQHDDSAPNRSAKQQQPLQLLAGCARDLAVCLKLRRPQIDIKRAIKVVPNCKQVGADATRGSGL